MENAGGGGLATAIIEGFGERIAAETTRIKIVRARVYIVSIDKKKKIKLQR